MKLKFASYFAYIHRDISKILHQRTNCIIIYHYRSIAVEYWLSYPNFYVILILIAYFYE